MEKFHPSYADALRCYLNCFNSTAPPCASPPSSLSERKFTLLDPPRAAQQRTSSSVSSSNQLCLDGDELNQLRFADLLGFQRLLEAHHEHLLTEEEAVEIRRCAHRETGEVVRTEADQRGASSAVPLGPDNRDGLQLSTCSPTAGIHDQQGEGALEEPPVSVDTEIFPPNSFIPRDLNHELIRLQIQLLKMKRDEVLSEAVKGSNV
jgi:hypothetical protein